MFKVPVADPGGGGGGQQPSLSTDPVSATEVL